MLGKRGPFNAAGKNVNYSRHYGNYCAASQKTENKSSISPSATIPGYSSKGYSSSAYYRDTHQRSLANCSTVHIS